MSLRKPSRMDIQTDNIVPIVNREGKVLGTAKLIKRRPSRTIQDNLPYVREQVKRTSGDEDDIPETGQKPTLYIWSYERWEVEWIKHGYYRPGDRTCTEVNFYECTTTDYPSFVDLNTEGNKGVNPSGLYVFLEEEGVLSLDQESYEEEAIKCLRRIKRSLDGEIIIYTHNPIQVKLRWELHKMPYRIFEFLSTEKSFARQIKHFLSVNPVEDYVILSGQSGVLGDRVIQADPETGLILNNIKSS